MVVKPEARRLREGQGELGNLAAEERRGAGDGVGDQHGGEVGVVVAPALPQRLSQHASVGIDEALVGVHELRGPERLPEHLQLLGVPAVVLVAQRQQLDSGRSQPQRPLEVAIEAQALLGA